MKLKQAFPILCLLVFLTSCVRREADDKPKTTRVTIISNTGIPMFSATSEGPFRIEIEGADVDIKLLKDEPAIEEEAKKVKK